MALRAARSSAEQTAALATAQKAVLKPSTTKEREQRAGPDGSASGRGSNTALSSLGEREPKRAPGHSGTKRDGPGHVNEHERAAKTSGNAQQGADVATADPLLSRVPRFSAREEFARQMQKLIDERASWWGRCQELRNKAAALRRLRHGTRQLLVEVARASGARPLSSIDALALRDALFSADVATERSADVARDGALNALAEGRKLLLFSATLSGAPQQPAKRQLATLKLPHAAWRTEVERHGQAGRQDGGSVFVLAFRETTKSNKEARLTDFEERVRGVSRAARCLLGAYHENARAQKRDKALMEALDHLADALAALGRLTVSQPKQTCPEHTRSSREAPCGTSSPNSFCDMLRVSCVSAVTGRGVRRRRFSELHYALQAAEPLHSQRVKTRLQRAAARVCRLRNLNPRSLAVVPPDVLQCAGETVLAECLCDARAALAARLEDVCSRSADGILARRTLVPVVGVFAAALPGQSSAQNAKPRLFVPALDSTRDEWCLPEEVLLQAELCLEAGLSRLFAKATQPSAQPSAKPSAQPSAQSSGQPSAQPSAKQAEASSLLSKLSAKQPPQPLAQPCMPPGEEPRLAKSLDQISASQKDVLEFARVLRMFFSVEPCLRDLLLRRKRLSDPLSCPACRTISARAATLFHDGFLQQLMAETVDVLNRTSAVPENPNCIVWRFPVPPDYAKALMPNAAPGDVFLHIRLCRNDPAHPVAQKRTTRRAKKKPVPPEPVLPVERFKAELALEALRVLRGRGEQASPCRLGFATVPDAKPRSRVAEQRAANALARLGLPLADTVDLLTEAAIALAKAPDHATRSAACGAAGHAALRSDALARAWRDAAAPSRSPTQAKNVSQLCAGQAVRARDAAATSGFSLRIAARRTRPSLPKTHA